MKTFTFLISIFLLFGSFSTKAQPSTYTVSGPIKGQGPLLNTEPIHINSGSNGWTVIHPYNAYGSKNSWSSAQSIGFPFSFYGSPATHFCVSKNYLLTFDTTVAGTTVNSSITTDNTALPNANLPDHTIAYFWGGFSPPLDNNDDVQIKTFGTIPNRQLWIQNFSYKHEAQRNSYNFVVLEETTHKIYVVDAQWVTQGVGSYTVGVQLNSTTAVQHSSSPNISSINTSGGANPWPNVDYYEFTPRSLVNDDAGILSLDAPASSTASGSQLVQVSIKNHGLNSLASVRVGWSIDGIAQTSHSWTGSLALGAVAAAVNIGSYNFTLGNPTLKIWTSNPNGNADNYTSNDTLEVSLFVCNLLSGAYTLGGTSSDFPNFDSLATFLNNCGISGPVIIKVAPGTYREQFTLGNIAGVSPTNTIVIDGGDSSLARLTHDGSTSNATVAFNSTSYVSLRNITLENTKSSTNAWVVHLQNTDHIVIDSCLIEMSVDTTAERGGIVGSGSLSDSYIATTNNHLTISNNTITGGFYGIILEGIQAMKMWANRILHNRFSDIDDMGIFMRNADSLMISGNVIENTNNSFSVGIYCLNITDFEIRANNLLDCGNEGIVIYGGSSSGTARSLIANNMIYAPNAAIRMSRNNSNVNIYHNTAVGNPAMKFTGSSFDMSIYNNIFSNPNGAALKASSSLPSTIDIDYNLYHYQASGGIARDNLSYSSLAAWQAVKPALNQNSVEGNPLFVSATSPVDLHLAGTLANDTGDNSVGIKVDIDGDSRPLPPSTRVDIGADEYHLPTCLPSSRLSASARSGSAASLSWTASGALNWNIEYGPQGFIPGSGTFVYNVLNPYILTGLNPNTNYDFYVQDSCGVGDVSLWTGPFTFQIACVNALSGTYTLGRASSDFPDFDSLATFLNNCGILGPVIIKVASGTYREQFTLGNIAGVSPTNTIVIDGGSSLLVTLTHDGSTSNATVAFDSTSYVSLRNMTLENTKNLPDAWVVHLQNTDHIVIDSCLIEMSVGIIAGTVERGGIVGSGSLSSSYTPTTNKHLTVSDNIFIKGFYGIALQGNTNNEDVGNRILRNRFSDIRDIGIFMSNADSLMISGNVTENTHSSLAVASGIYCEGITDFEIRANNVPDCRDGGITIDRCSSSGAARSLIANNMIYANNSAITIWGNNSNVNIYHNTAVGDPAMYVGGNISDMSLYNNIFINPNGVALSAYPGLLSTIDIDYNLYQYQASWDIAKDGFTSYANLAAWQAAKPALNAHSIEGDPVFVRETAPADLHVLDSLANDTGKSNLGIRVDIDNDPRPLPPSTRVDIGADEYNLSRCLLSPTNLSASITGSTTAVLSWTIRGASNWNVRWDTAGFTPGMGNFVYNASRPYTLTGLNPGDSYDFYVQDSCWVHDVSAWSGPYSFRMPIILSCPAPTGLGASISTFTTAILSWTTGGASNWNVEWGTAGFTPRMGNFVYNATNPQTLTGLNPGNYEFYVRDSCGVGNVSSWSGPYSFRISVCPGPFNLAYSVVTPTSASISWTAGGASNWNLEYGSQGFTPGSGTFVYNVSNPYTVSGLTPGTTYDFYVRDSCGVGHVSLWTGPHTFTTLSVTLPCPSPSSLGATNITQTSATLSWVTGGASNWNLEWGIVNFALGSGNFLPNVAPTHYTLSGLIPGTSYQFYVRDSCGVGHVSSWAGHYTFTTLSVTLPCPAPSSLGASNITQTTAIISWATGGSSNWNMEYGVQGSVRATFVYNIPNPYTLSGLKPGTLYDVYVQDSCGVGNVSNWAGPLSIKTIIGIDELLERSLRIYPNPSEGVFKLEFSSSLGEDMEIRIINMLGQIVLEDEIESFSGSYRKKLEMGAYRSGVYLLQLITEKATVNRRIILQ